MSDAVLMDVNECFKSVIRSSIDNLTKEEMEKCKPELMSIVDSYALLLQHHDLACTAADRVASHLDHGDSDLLNFNPTEIFKKELHDLESSKAKEKASKDPCQDLRKLLDESGEKEELIEVVSRNDARSQQGTVKLDPFTRKPIEQAARSTKCNHLFDYKTVERMFSHLKGNKQTLKCPHIGCIAVLTFKDIEKM